MRQSRLMSGIEAVANVVVGYVVAVTTQLLVFPRFWLSASLTPTLAIGSIFTDVSLAHIEMPRRIFRAVRTSFGAT
ncbi:MAG: hypothetical protein H0T41_00840 [Rhodobacteraceae bacterium]|nr:hypothetical protein [Paracoccaceae bacterium]